MFRKPSLSFGAGVTIAILLGPVFLHREAQAVEYPTLTVLRELNGLGGRRLSVRGTLAFVQRTNALAVFDLANFANPVPKGVLNLSTAAEGMHASVTVSDNLLALAAYPGGSAPQRIYLINISDIERPALATSWEASPSSMTFAQDFLFVTSSIGDSLRVYDVSNPTAPNLVFSEVDRLLPFENGDPPTVRGDAEGVVIRGNYAFVRYGSGRRQVGGRTVLPLLVVYNVSNPAAPTEVTSAAIPTIRTYCYPSLALTGPTLLFSGFFFGDNPADKGVSTMDVGDPFQPRFVADMQGWDVPNLGVSPSVLYAAPVAALAARCSYLQTGSLWWMSLLQPCRQSRAYSRRLPRMQRSVPAESCC